MKRYRKYMDEIRATDNLRQRLRELEAPVKRPLPWKNYSVMAAALALVLGLGGYGVHYWNTVVNPRGQAFLDATQAYHPEDDPNIATETPVETEQPGDKILGKYEYYEHEGVTTYRILPYIEYGDCGIARIDWDLDIPQGATRRDLSQDEIIALMGGEDAVNTHLDWSGYELSGWAAWREDGSFWGAYIDGVKPAGGPEAVINVFEFAVTAGQLPPTCFGGPNSVTQEIGGLTVTADKLDWPREFSDNQVHCYERRVSFMKDGYGYRFEMSGGSGEETEVLVSRLVCCVADERLALWTVDPNASYICSDCGQTVPANTKHSHPHIGVDENGSPYTEPYDPNADAPPVSVSDEPYVCTGYPTPDPAESWEICDGVPLAPEGWTRPSSSDAATDTNSD